MIYGEYKDWEDAERQNAVVKGWVPVYLPKTATDIFEKHDLDLNQLWGYFSYDSNEKVSQHCKQISRENIRFSGIAPNWIRQGVGVASLKKDKSFKYYQCNKINQNCTIAACSSPEYMALNPKGRGAYWYLGR